MMDHEYQYSSKEAQALHDLIVERGRHVVRGIKEFKRFKKVFEHAVQKAGVVLTWDPSTPPALKEHLTVVGLSMMRFSIAGGAVALVVAAFTNRPVLVTARGYRHRRAPRRDPWPSRSPERLAYPRLSRRRWRRVRRDHRRSLPRYHSHLTRRRRPPGAVRTDSVARGSLPGTGWPSGFSVRTSKNSVEPARCAGADSSRCLVRGQPETAPDGGWISLAADEVARLDAPIGRCEVVRERGPVVITDQTAGSAAALVADLVVRTAR